jgi:integrase
MSRKRTYKKHRHPGVRPRSPGVFIVDYIDHNGKRHQKTFHGTEIDAARFRRQLLAKVDRIKAGLEPPPEEQKALPTLAELWQEFQQDRQLKVDAGSLEQSTLTRYGDAVKAVESFDSDLMNQPLDQLEPSSFERFKIHRRMRGLSPAGINTNIRHLRGIFNYAVRRGYITTSPLRDVGFISVQSPDVRFLNEDELNRLKAVLDSIDVNDQFQRDARDLVIFYLYTGARSSEALYPTFTWNCVESTSIRFPKTKRHKSRTIPKGKVVAVMLESRRDISGGPFNGIKNAYWVYNRVRYILSKASIPDASPQTLRKTAGAWYLMATGNIYATQQFLGHSSVDVTARHYAGLIQSMQVDYAEQFERLLNERLQYSCNSDEKSG